MTKKILTLLTLTLLLEGITFFLLFSSASLKTLARADLPPEDKILEAAPKTLPSKLKFYTQGKTWEVEGKVAASERSLGEFLLAIEKEIVTPPQDAELEMTEGRVTTFVPHQNGQALDLARARLEALTALTRSTGDIELKVVISPPKTKLQHLNNLGIKELVARGQSDFSGSSRSRITNIKVGSSKFNGLIIKPDEEFSFNKNLGPITAQNGYQPEIVIKPEGLTPELGGGLCQVSTTAFRAAFFGGLPITARRNHSFPVRYYEWISDDKPKAVGLDATIYPGAQDLKFVNDTSGAILIWTRVEGTRVYFDFYGTPDEREVLVDGPQEYDRKASGAVKAKVTRTIIKDGQKQEQAITSNYVSPNLYPKLYIYPKPVEPQTNN